jgi:hypothetical protein
MCVHPSCGMSTDLGSCADTITVTWLLLCIRDTCMHASQIQTRMHVCPTTSSMPTDFATCAAPDHDDATIVLHQGGSFVSGSMLAIVSQRLVVCHLTSLFLLPRETLQKSARLYKDHVCMPVCKGRSLSLHVDWFVVVIQNRAF